MSGMWNPEAELMSEVQIRIIQAERLRRLVRQLGGRSKCFNGRFEEAGIDSLSMIEIIFELEEAFDIAIPDPTTVEERVQTFKTPREVVAMVQSLIEERDTAE